MKTKYASNEKTNEDQPCKMKKRKWLKKSKYQKMVKKQKKQRVSVIFNYSSINLTKDMESLLNRGLNYSVLPEKLNLTQVLVDFKRFERTMLWTEFWSGKPKEEYKPPLFKKQKTNLPTKHPTPAALKTMLAATKSEILDPENQNKSRPNLPPGEMKALARLIELQKQQVITIKPCDKGAGIIILDFQEYIRACEVHLSAEQTQLDGSTKPYYQKVEEDAIEEIRKKS